METKLLNNLTKVLNEIKEKYSDIVIKLDDSDFSILKNDKRLTSGTTRYHNGNKIEIYDSYAKRYKVVNSYKKLKEIIENNVELAIENMRINNRKEYLKEILEKIDYIKENYDLYSAGGNGFMLSPKKCCSKFYITVKNWADIGIKTYLKFNEEFKIDELDKIQEITEEFKKVTKLIEGQK